MIGELIRTTTQDGLQLQGLLATPEGEAKGVVLLIHGLEGNFYENCFFDDVAQAVTEAGWAFAAVNTRGAGVLASFNTDVPGQYREYGAAREVIEDSLADLGAWLDYLEKRGFKSVLLSGHSLGTLKVVYYQAQRQDPRVKGIVLMGAVDYHSFARETAGEHLEEYLEEAKEMVAVGRGEEFTPKAWHFLTLMSYRSFYDWFRPDSPARIFEFSQPDFAYSQLQSLKVPLLVLQGEKDQYLQNPQASLALISQHTAKCAPMLIKGADHWYSGGTEQLKQSLRDWLAPFSP